MAKVAIKGHLTRGKEVVEILEMLGGKNAYNFIGACNVPEFAYSINEQGIIDLSILYLNSCYTIFTLEEFLEKYSYKVGDKVQHKGATSCGSIYEVEKMRWEADTVKYTLRLFGCNYKTSTLPTEYLQPYKEETMDRKYDVEKYLQVWKETEKGLEVLVNDRFELKEDNGKFYIVKKQPQYPKTYEECCDILDAEPYGRSAGYKSDLITAFRNLLICRDAYWKIAGDEMGLDKLWKPYNGQESCKKHVIQTVYNKVTCLDTWCQTRNILEFPTEEMRDAFYENFKELIESCKELL